MVSTGIWANIYGRNNIYSTHHPLKCRLRNSQVISCGYDIKIKQIWQKIEKGGQEGYRTISLIKEIVETSTNGESNFSNIW